MKLLKLNSFSVTIELENDYCYYNNKEYEVILNDNILFKDNRNVITIYDLSENTDYKLKINNDILEFTTPDTNIVYIDSYNVKKDGITDDTVKLQAALLTIRPNQTLVITEGTYLVSALYFKSNTNIYFKKNSKIISMIDRSSYPIHPADTVGIWEGSKIQNFASVFNFIDVDNVNVYGDLEIDSRAKMGDWYINHRVMNMAYRGHAIYMNNSNNIDIVGLYVHDTFSWAIHPFDSKNIGFYNLFIENEQSMPTTDGIDPDCCDNVVIKGCRFNVGDDCIAIKSATYELAKKMRKPCSNLVISNNLMEAGHGGVVFGSESSGGIKNVLINKCLFKNTDRGLRIKTRRGRGNISSIDNICFDNIIMEDVKTPFVINMYYNMGPAGGHEEYVWTYDKQEFCELTPVLGSFKFTNCKCTGVCYAAGVFLGLAESKIKQIEFENVSFSYNTNAEPGYPVMIEHNVLYKNVGLDCFNVENVITNNVTFIGIDKDLIIKR